MPQTARTDGPTPEDVQKLVGSARLFVNHVLGDETWSVQDEILDSVSVNRRTAVKSCHGTGKSWLAARVLLWWMWTRSPAIAFTTAPTGAQVRSILWKEVRVAYSKLPPELRKLGRCLTTELQIAADHFAFGRATNDPENLQGTHSPHLLVIADEACGITDEMYQVIDTFSSGGEYRELLIGNPTQTGGKFYKAFTVPALGYNCISIPADTTPNFTGEPCSEKLLRQIVNREKVEQWGIEWGTDSPAYQARVKAEFPDADAENTLVPLSWHNAALGRGEEEHQGTDTTAQLGVDIARYGSDRCCMAGRVGSDLKLLKSLAGKTGTLEAVGWIAEEALAWTALHGSVTVLVDEGYNPGVVDLLLARSDAGVTYQAVSFGAAALDPEKHSSRRHEMLWGLRELYRGGNNDPDLRISARGPEVDRLGAQVSAIRFRYDARMRPRVESKDEMKDRGMPSPDETDAVALAFACSGAPRPFWQDPDYIAELQGTQGTPT